MKRRIFSLLIVLCMIVGLLPAITLHHAHAATTTRTVDVLTGSNYFIRLTADTAGTATYTKNEEVVLEDADGAAYSEWKQVVCESTDNWNMKYYYDTTTKKFTLRMKGAKLVSAKASYGVGVSDKSVTTQGGEMAFVIEEDSYIEAGSAIKSVVGGSYRWTATYVTSENDATLTAKCRQGFAAIHVMRSLYLNANVDLTVTSNYAIYCQAVSNYNDIVYINGGNINLMVNYPGSGATYHAIYGADGTTLNGGRITAEVESKGVFGNAPVIAEGLCYTVANFSGDPIAEENLTTARKVIFTAYGEHTDTKTTEDVIEDATCGKDGSKTVTVTCNTCGKVVSETTEAIPATGAHNYSEWELVSGFVCAGADYERACSVCGHVDKKNEPGTGEHTLTAHEAAAPSCTANGNVAYWSCSICGKNFADAEGTTVLEGVVDPATGHAWNDATCTAPKTCGTCGATEGEALGHTEVEVAEQDATTSAAGYKAGTKCSVCNAILSGCEEIPNLKTVTIRIMSWSDMTADESGKVSYYKTVAKQGYTSQGVENGEYWTVASGNANDWNIKFEYPRNGVPTLTFKNATLDHIGEDGTALYTKQADGTFKYTGTLSAVLIKSGYISDLKVILQGNNHFETNNGIIRGNVGAKSAL